MWALATSIKSHYWKWDLTSGCSCFREASGRPQRNQFFCWEYGPASPSLLRIYGWLKHSIRIPGTHTPGSIMRTLLNTEQQCKIRVQLSFTPFSKRPAKRMSTVLLWMSCRWLPSPRQFFKSSSIRKSLSILFAAVYAPSFFFRFSTRLLRFDQSVIM